MEILDHIARLVFASQRFTMLEFGACDGYHTNLFLEMLLASGRSFSFHSFEPVPDNYKLAAAATRAARKRLGDGQHFEIHRLAVGAKVGEVPLYISGGEKKAPDGTVLDRYYGSSSIRTPKEVVTAWPDMTFVIATTPVVSLDRFVAVTPELSPLNTIDFIWADIQGAEVDLIRGGTDTWPRVRYLYTEYCNSELYDGEVGIKEICAMLPEFEVVEDYGGDVLLHNRALP